MSENKDKKPLGKNGVDMGERGVYDKRNSLNDLTGKEWIFFTNSVWITGFSPTAKENVGIKIRKIHPSPKPPVLMRDIIKFFTKTNGRILDPFCGVGGTPLGAALADEYDVENGISDGSTGRTVVGIELEQKYIDAYCKVCQTENLKEFTVINDDAANMLNHAEIMDEEFDLILTDPPYGDMMGKERTGQSKKNNDDSAPRNYTDSSNDLGNMDSEQFLESLRTILKRASTRLKKKGYMVVFCKDFQPQPGKTNLLHADIINEIVKIEGIEYKGMRIWHDQAMSLFPFGYPYSFIMNQLHQYILIFRKEG